MKHLTAALLVLLTLACVTPLSASPHHGRDHGDDSAQAAAGGISLDQAVAMVERRFNARVVRTEVQEDGGRKIYVLRLLNDAGRVWSVRVDAASGSIL